MCSFAYVSLLSALSADFGVHRALAWRCDLQTLLPEAEGILRAPRV
jgi:hypothetical protein